MMNKQKTVDCVAIQHAGAEQIRRATDGLTPAELLEYWRTRSAALRERQQRLASRTQEAATFSRPVAQ